METTNNELATNSDTAIPRQTTWTYQIDPELLLELLREFCVKMFVEKSPDMKEMKEKLYTYLAKILPDLCDRLNEEILEKEENIVYVSSPSFVFGDIHGNVEDLYDYESLFWNTNEKTANYVFLGDFVDRGVYGVEVCAYLFALKLLAPEQFSLIRGNHEIREINKNYTFYEECIRKFGEYVGEVIYDKINSCFERLPLAAVVDNSVFCCHGGVPKNSISSTSAPVSVDYIMQIQKPLIDPSIESHVAKNLMWNDPIESMTTYNTQTEKLLESKNIGFVENEHRATGWYYTAAAVQKFLDFNRFDYLIRAHESVEEGFKIHSNHRAVTIFSSSNYMGLKNTTACVKVTSELVQIVIIKPSSDKTNFNVEPGLEQVWTLIQVWPWISDDSGSPNTQSTNSSTTVSTGNNTESDTNVTF